MEHYKEVMKWLSFQKDLQRVPQSVIYARYADEFDTPVSKTMFGKILRSQNILRKSRRINGKIVKVFSTDLNPELSYIKVSYRHLCPNCQGKGYVITDV